MTISEQYYHHTKEAQAKWAEAMQSVFNEAKKAFDGESLRVDTAATGERVQKGIDQFFDFWSKAFEFNRDLTKKVAEANLEYLNVLNVQAQAAGGQYLARFEEARVRTERVARETQDAVAKSTAELEATATQVANRATEEFERNVSTAAEQAVKLSQQAGERAENATAEGEKTANRARSSTKET